MNNAMLYRTGITKRRRNKRREAQEICGGRKWWVEVEGRNDDMNEWIALERWETGRGVVARMIIQLCEEKQEGQGVNIAGNTENDRQYMNSKMEGKESGFFVFFWSQGRPCITTSDDDMIYGRDKSIAYDDQTDENAH
jgi:hypothetical protein